MLEFFMKWIRPLINKQQPGRLPKKLLENEVSFIVSAIENDFPMTIQSRRTDKKH